MSIKYKLGIIASVSVLVIGLLGALLYFSLKSLNYATEKNRTSVLITKNVFDRRLFLDDYLAYHLDRSKQQWLSAHESLVAYVQNKAWVFLKENEKTLIRDIQDNFSKNKLMFLQLVAIHESNDPELTDQARQDQESRLSSQLLSRSQTLISSAVSLTTVSDKDAAAAQKNIAMVLVGFILGLFLFIAIFIFFLWKSIAGPLARLKMGVKYVAEGNLDTKVGTNTSDEIGQLSRAFDQMTEKIKQRSISLDASNQQLRASNQQLRASNQQLDATTQQLRAANQQLAAAEKGLKEKIGSLEIFNKVSVGRELKMVELKKEIENLRKQIGHP